MPAEQDVARLQERLAAYRATLSHYLGQLAISGSAHARPEVTHGIREARAGIQQVKAALRAWGVPVEDHPDDNDELARATQVLHEAAPALALRQQDELARRLAALLANDLGPEALRERLLADPALAPLLAALAGREVRAGQTVLTLGAGNQTGNVQIRDVAGGNIVTFNVYYDTPRSTPVAPVPASSLERPLRVFLCHAAGDKPAVRALYARLQADGFAPWLDEEDLVPGQDWQRVIPEEVRTADAVVVCLSQAALTKAGYVQNEIAFALDVAEQQPPEAIFLIPLRLEACEVPERLRRWHWVDYFEAQGYPRLMRALRIRANQLALSAEQPPPVVPPVQPEPIAEPSPSAAAPPAGPTPIAAQPPPDHGDLPRLWRRARLAYNARQWAEAEALLIRVAELDPNYQDVQARLAEARRQITPEQRYAALAILRESDRWEEVLARWRQLTAQAPGYPDPQGHRAWAEGRQRRKQRLEAARAAMEQTAWRTAITELEALLAEFPDDAEATALLERARAEQEAAEGRQRREQRLEAALAAMEQTDWRTAITELEALLAEFPDDEEAPAFLEHARAEQEAAEQRQREEPWNTLAALEATLAEDPTDRAAAAMLARLIETPAAPFALRLRAAALAGRVGDPRFPVTMEQWRAELVSRSETFGQPAGYWCYVPAGTYRIGGWGDDEAVGVPLSPFWIARYPITVAQYKPFVAVGYAPDAERWWTLQGWQWKLSETRMQPWFWEDARYNALNQPVVGVTWYEVTAYCTWLTEQLGDALPAGYVLRLPTEAEWEAAAAWDGRIGPRLYPWGEAELTPELAIFKASRLGRPAPVGCCPAGAAACGALDLVGNVWEWTASSYKDYPARSGVPVEDFTPAEEDVPVRGGSWWVIDTLVCCRARKRVLPSIVNDVVGRGLRVCAAPRLHRGSEL